MTRSALRHLVSPREDEVLLSERRDQDRYTCDLRALCRPIEHPRASTPWPARLLDISATGLQLLLTRRFEAGSLLSIEVRTREGGSVTLLAHVVRVFRTGHRHDFWYLGCSLACGIGADDLEELVESAQISWLKSKRVFEDALEELGSQQPTLPDIELPPLEEPTVLSLLEVGSTFEELAAMVPGVSEAMELDAEVETQRLIHPGVASESDWFHPALMPVWHEANVLDEPVANRRSIVVAPVPRMNEDFGVDASKKCA